ncbi:mCG1049288, partial [Mus musculus]
MDERDSHCPYLLSSETTAKGKGLVESVVKEDPVELDSSL